MIPRRPLSFAIGTALLVACGAWAWHFFFVGKTWTPVAPLTQEAYVWQRRWNNGLRESVTRSQELLDGLCVEVAEMSRRNGKIEFANAAVDWSVLALLKKPVGLAWRIGAPVVAQGWTNEVRAEIGRTIFDSLAKARSLGITISEAQIDCDCPARLLGEYAKFIQSLRSRDSGVRWTFTALPSWLHSADFKRLAYAADGFVLQVHWLRPDALQQGKATLMIPTEAREAVAQASRFGVPFRVALPTYGSAVITDAGGRWLDVLSEEQGDPPSGKQLIEARSSPDECLALVADWKSTRPAWLTGIAWYRLPVAADRRNWSWLQFEAVVRGRKPVARFEVALKTNAEGWEDVLLNNVGDGDDPAPQNLRIETAGVLAADGVNGYHAEEIASGTFRFSTVKASYLKAGQTLPAGWLRRGKSGAPFTVNFEP